MGVKVKKFGRKKAKFDMWGISRKELKKFGITLGKIRVFCIGKAKVERFFFFNNYGELKNDEHNWGKME